MILSGDIGGTNTRLALFESEKKIAEERFLSRNYPNLLPIIQIFLKQHKISDISRASLGIAGPVHNGQCRTTNLPWVVDGQELERDLKIKTVFILNDLEACAWGLRLLQSQDLLLLHAGESRKGNVALIAAGTGLGEAGLFWDGKKHCPFACEGGHTDFAPRDDREIDLLLYMKKIYGHVSYERIISGPGLYHLYQFLIASGRERASREVQHEMTLKDPSIVITDWSERDPACTHTVDWFISLYGAETGNLALKILALGGVYISGKIAKNLQNVIKQGGFIKAFQDKGRFSELLKTIPVHLVLNDDTAILGAAEYARTH